MATPNYKKPKEYTELKMSHHFLLFALLPNNRTRNAILGIVKQAF
jgi:hypothetical protein